MVFKPDQTGRGGAAQRKSSDMSQNQEGCGAVWGNVRWFLKKTSTQKEDQEQLIRAIWKWCNEEEVRKRGGRENLQN